MDLSVELPSYCSLHQQVNLIEDKKSVLPEIKMQLPESRAEIRKKAFSKIHKSFTKSLSFSHPAAAVRNKEVSKMHKSCTKPLSFARSTGIYLIEFSST